MGMYKGKRNEGIRALQIKGDSKYINNLYAHLRKEHPSTRKRMRLVN